MFETQARVHRPKREGAGGDADRPETSIRPHCHYERNINHTASQHDGNVYLDTPPAGCSGWKGSSPGKEAQEEEETETSIAATLSKARAKRCTTRFWLTTVPFYSGTFGLLVCFVNARTLGQVDAQLA